MKRALFFVCVGLLGLFVWNANSALSASLDVATPYRLSSGLTRPSAHRDLGIVDLDGVKESPEGRMRTTVHARPVLDSSPPDTLPQDSAAVLFDQIVLSLLGDSATTGIAYGLDTTVSPCEDFFSFVNGGWRKQVTLPATKDRTRQMAGFFPYARMRMLQRLTALVDSARKDVEDPTLRVLGTFYASCLHADSLEPNYYHLRNPSAHVRDSTRAEQCLRRTIVYLGGAAGQAFAQDLQRSGAVTRMEQLLATLREAVEERIRQNTIMSDEEKAYALNRLGKLILRVGIPDQAVDYSPLHLSSTDYAANTVAINNFNNTRAFTARGNVRERWKASLLTPNAFYMPGDHAIEIPTLMFSPPFFFRAGDDLLNFAGVGNIIAHEIFHSIAPQLPVIEDPRMQVEIDSFKAFNTSMGTFDGWTASGPRTFQEDVADLGGSRVAYRAWQLTIARDSTYRPDTIAGFTPAQRFFIAAGRIWRSAWTEAGIHNDAHAPNFARVNAVAMQNPAFKQVFGCHEGEKMFLPDEKMSAIW